MEIQEYTEIFKSIPPEHLCHNGQVFCSVCGKNAPQVKKLMGQPGLFPCEDCTKKQSDHPPLTPPSDDEKMNNMSPEEVLSGGLYGGKNEFKSKSKTGWNEEHKQEVKDFRDTINNL